MLFLEVIILAILIALIVFSIPYVFGSRYHIRDKIIISSLVFGIFFVYKIFGKIFRDDGNISLSEIFYDSTVLSLTSLIGYTIFSDLVCSNIINDDNDWINNGLITLFISSSVYLSDYLLDLAKTSTSFLDKKIKENKNDQDQKEYLVI